MSRALLPWLYAFLFTQGVEVPLYVALMRNFPAPRGRGVPGERDQPPTPPQGLAGQIAVAFGASLLTHPIVWFLIPRLEYQSYWVMVARAEVFAVVVEGLYFYALQVFSLQRAMRWSLLANASSLGLGLLSRAIFGWP